MLLSVNEQEITRFFLPVAEELEMVETELNNMLQDSGIANVRNCIEDYGSMHRYLRAGIILLAAKSVERAPAKRADNKIISLASIMELIYHALLVHNHIGENAGETGSYYTDTCDKIAVLAGDLLFTRAFFIAAQSLPANNFRDISDLTLKICMADIKTVVLKDSALSSDKYLQLIKEKTAAFFSMGFKLSAILSSAVETETMHLEKIGFNLGMLYQISTDMANSRSCLPADFDFQKLDAFAGNCMESIKYLKESIYRDKLSGLLDCFLVQR